MFYLLFSESEMADELDVDAMLEAPFQKEVSVYNLIILCSFCHDVYKSRCYFTMYVYVLIYKGMPVIRSVSLVIY